MRVWMLCLLAATTLCASSLRADDPLAYIPADSGVVVRIAPRAELEKRLDGFLAAIGPRAGNSAAALDDVLGEIFAVGGGNARRAVDPASPIYLALFAYKDDEGRPLSPAPRAFFLKTADLDDVRKRLGAVESIDEVLTKKRDDGFEEIRTPRGLAFLAKRGDWAV
ncbi:MAG TPA: hypothetical protein VGE52_12440, partial [Pirellulales bacterium]